MSLAHFRVGFDASFRGSALLLQIAVVAAVLAQAPAAEKPKIVVLELAPAGVEVEVAGAITEAMTSHLASRGMFDVLGAREIETLVSLERQKQLLGCGDDNASCFAELGGALGARFVLSGTLAKLGNSYQLTLQMLDTQNAQTAGRSTRIAPTLEALRAMLPWALADATGTPPPPRPSNALSYSLVLTGAVALAGGGVVGFNALSREERMLEELKIGETNENILSPAQVYRTEANRLAIEKTGAAVALGVGAALIGAGVLVYESDPSAEGSSVALVPTFSGAALVGVFR